jgi:citrate synthase
VVACSTAISTIAGTTLLYRGYTIEDLAAHATFEEVAHLLWFGRLPNADELARFQRQLDEAMPLPAESFGWFHGLPTDVHPMDFLHAVVAGLSLHDPDANVLTYEANLRKAVRLTARLATIIAAYDRVRSGQWPLQPMPGARSRGTSCTCCTARSPRRDASGNSTPVWCCTPTTS